MSQTDRLKKLKSNYQFGFSMAEKYVFKSRKGLDQKIVEEISYMKKEPDWMLRFRLHAYQLFLKKPLPTWGGNLLDINFDNIYYYLKPIEKEAKTWEELPKGIRQTYDRLGIPEAEKKYLAGVKGQYESEVIYGSLLKSLEEKGVVFLGMDEGLRRYPDLVKKYFGTVIPSGDNKFAALNSSVWSGGSFIYVPRGVKIDLPLQAYFRINAANMGQFERTLIIADEGSFVSYIEGCSAPVYSTDSLHSAVVEIIVHRGARVRYTTIQNWSTNVYNLVTKRAQVFGDGVMEWVDFNGGCLAGDSPVFLNPHGLKEIKDVKAGDKIYVFDLNTLKPTKAKVVASQKTGTRSTFKLTTENFREIVATDNHPFMVLERRPFSNLTHLVWKSLINLKIGDAIATVSGLPDDGHSFEISFDYQRVGSKGLKNVFASPSKTDERLMWLLGVYLGDGYLEYSRGGRPRRTYFAVPEKDRIRGKLIETLEKMGLTWRPKGICVTVGSSSFTAFIEGLGFSRLASRKRLPGWVFTLPNREKLSFLLGYFESDGHLRNRRNQGGEELGQIIFASVNRQLLEDVKLLMISVGLNPLKISAYTQKRSLSGLPEKTYTSYYLSLNLKENRDILFGLKNPTERLEFVRIKNIEPQGIQDVYDLEIEGVHNFVANGIVVHNSKLTMKYPSVYLMEPGARGEILSLAFAGAGQHQDAGGKAVHLAPNTSSQIISKSVSLSGGRTSYRGLLHVHPQAKGSKSKVVCDALILDSKSRSDTYPTMKIENEDVAIEHEATVSKVGEEQLFYLTSRGLTETQASSLIVSGFVEPIVKQLPLEYAVELNRLIELQMEGSVG